MPRAENLGHSRHAFGRTLAAGVAIKRNIDDRAWWSLRFTLTPTWTRNSNLADCPARPPSNDKRAQGSLFSRALDRLVHTSQAKSASSAPSAANNGKPAPGFGATATLQQWPSACRRLLGRGAGIVPAVVAEVAG